MLDALESLLKSGVINEETRTAINAAWEAKLTEMKSEIRTNTREEFAERYEHDKKVMVKTLDKMVAETLSKEISQVKEERNQVSKLKLKTVNEMKSAAKKFNAFATRALAEELAEFAQERKLTEAHKNKLEKFVFSSLAEEINEFAEDKQALRETRVRLIAEGKNQLAALKEKFIQRSAPAVSKIVSETLNHEIKQLHEDIKKARQNNFGRKIFEAFATEFTGTYLNENVEVKKLKTTIEDLSKKLNESKSEIKTKTQLVESKQKDLKRLQDRSQRDKVLSELLSPLADKNKREVMSQLLESVQTGQLRKAYDKYLPAVLNNREPKVDKTECTVLHESTGDKTSKVVPADESTLSDIKRLAGLK